MYCMYTVHSVHLQYTVFNQMIQSNDGLRFHTVFPLNSVHEQAFNLHSFESTKSNGTFWFKIKLKEEKLYNQHKRKSVLLKTTLSISFFSMWITGKTMDTSALLAIIVQYILYRVIMISFSNIHPNIYSLFTLKIFTLKNIHPKNILPKKY